MTYFDLSKFNLPETFNKTISLINDSKSATPYSNSHNLPIYTNKPENYTETAEFRKNGSILLTLEANITTTLKSFSQTDSTSGSATYLHKTNSIEYSNEDGTLSIFIENSSIQKQTKLTISNSQVVSTHNNYTNDAFGLITYSISNDLNKNYAISMSGSFKLNGDEQTVAPGTYDGKATSITLTISENNGDKYTYLSLKGNFDIQDGNITSGSISSVKYGDSYSSATTTFKIPNVTYAEFNALIDEQTENAFNIISRFGNDIIAGGTSDDVIYGYAGNDTLKGLAGNDKIYGGEGNDTIDGGEGNDTIDGGAGVDKITDLSGNNTISDLDGVATITTGLGNDDITTGNGNDTIKAGDGDNTIKAGEGNNNATTGLGNDNITSGAGNDTIKAGDGDNTIKAGEGNNTITTGLGADNITSGSGNDTIKAGDGINTIKAGDGNNTVTTGLGDDIITTGSGKDKITAGNGNNVIHAGAGDDTIVAGAGDDTLSGGAGKDTLTGGLGSDTFVFDFLESGLLTFDTIKDFKSGEDKLQFDASVFTALQGYTVDDLLIGTYSAATADTQSQHLIYDSKTGNLFYNADGSESGHAAIVLVANVKGAVASDFIDNSLPQ